MFPLQNHPKSGNGGGHPLGDENLTLNSNPNPETLTPKL